MDVRCLLNGGKVPLIKVASDWSLSLEGVLQIGAEGELPDLGTTEQKAKRTGSDGISQTVLFVQLWERNPFFG